MSQVEPHHLAAIGALAVAGDDQQAKMAAFNTHMDTLLEMMNGSLGPSFAKTVGNMLRGLQMTSASDTSHSSTAAAPGSVLSANMGLSWVGSSQGSPPLPSQSPASEPPATPSAGTSAMQDASRTSQMPSADRSTSVATTEPSITRPSPAPSRQSDHASAEGLPVGDTGPPTGAKRKRLGSDATASPAPSEASNAGRKLRERRPKANKVAEPSARRAPQRRAPRAKGGKGKKKAEVVDEKGKKQAEVVDEEDDEGSDDESVVYATKKTRISRMTALHPPAAPKPGPINDPPCASCEKAGAKCVRLETTRGAHACQRCGVNKVRCSLTQDEGASHVEGSTPAHTAPPAVPAPSATGLLPQDPLSQAQLDASLAQFCAYMARFNDIAPPMEALNAALQEFNAWAAQVTEALGPLESNQAESGGSLPPPSPCPSSESRDASPASQGSHERRRLDIAADASSAVPGLPLPSVTLAGGSARAGLPAAATGTAPGGSSEIASLAPTPTSSGPAADPSTPPRASADATGEGAAKGASGSGDGADMDVDKTPTQ